MAVAIGVLGAGTVGGTVVRRLTAEHDTVAVKTGLEFEVRRIAVRSLDKERPFAVPAGVITVRAEEVVADPGIDLIVELMGGVDPTGDLVLAALRAGKPVVTANKELIAARGPELFEAAAAAGVPLLRPVRRGHRAP